MNQSLRRTPTQRHLAYKNGEHGERRIGRNLSLLRDGAMLTLSIDLASNFRLRNKNSASYLDAVHLACNHRQLRYLQCSDHLVRSRLVRAWELVEQPDLRMCLELGQHGRSVYAVQPHLLFTGGIQFDVAQVLEEESVWAGPQSTQFHLPGRHA